MEFNVIPFRCRRSIGWSSWRRRRTEYKRRSKRSQRGSTSWETWAALKPRPTRRWIPRYGLKLGIYTYELCVDIYICMYIHSLTMLKVVERKKERVNTWCSPYRDETHRLMWCPWGTRTIIHAFTDLMIHHVAHCFSLVTNVTGIHRWKIRTDALLSMLQWNYLCSKLQRAKVFELTTRNF